MELEKVRAFFENNDHFARFIGCEIVDVGEGTARVKMPVGLEHLNGVGTVHGGAIFGLADFAFAIAVNSLGKIAVALNCVISYLKPGRNESVLTALARTLSVSNSTALIEVRIEDEAGQLISLFQGTAYRTREELSGIL